MRQVRIANRRLLHGGATAVEFAIAAPILFMLLFGAIEFSRANMLVNTTAIAATEAARAAIIPGATADQCREVCMRELSAIGVNTASITINPEEITDDTTQVTVSVSVPVGENGYMLAKYFLGKTVEKTATLQREGKNEAVENEPSGGPANGNANANANANANSGSGNSGS